MSINKEVLTPTPRDFGDYVYCGAKWLLDKNRQLDSIKDAWRKSYDFYQSQSDYNNLLIGQKNESNCIKWVLGQNHLKTNSIVFDGTGGNQRYMTTSAGTEKLVMKCKPDLILENGDSTQLYEFKAVKRKDYLYYQEFDSIHAQVWCYKFLGEIDVDQYFLVRYFMNPLQNPFTRIKELTTVELNNEKFESYFSSYLEAIEICKNNAVLASKIDLNKPKTDTDKQYKCSNCIYRKIHICEDDG